MVLSLSASQSKAASTSRAILVFKSFSCDSWNVYYYESNVWNWNRGVIHGFRFVLMIPAVNIGVKRHYPFGLSVLDDRPTCRPFGHSNKVKKVLNKIPTKALDLHFSVLSLRYNYCSPKYLLGVLYLLLLGECLSCRDGQSKQRKCCGR